MLTAKECVDETCIPRGLHLKLGFYVIWPYWTVITDPETDELSRHGMIPDYMIPFVFDSLNISHELVYYDGSDYTYVMENGTWTADFGLLQRGEVDVNVGAQPQEEERFDYFRSLESYQHYSVTLIASVGKREVYDFFSFLYKVEGPVWITLMVSMLVLIIISGVSDMFKKGIENRTNLFPEVYFSFWIYLAALFCEGSPRTMATRRGQFLQFMWLFSVLIFMTGLVGQFKAILMVKQDDDNMQSMEDLSERPHLITYVLKDTILERVLKDSILPHFQKVYALAKKRNSLITLEEFISPVTYQSIKDGKAVMVTPDQHGKCVLSMICPYVLGHRRLYFTEETFHPFTMNFFVMPDFPNYLRNLLDSRILISMEGGFANKWFAENYKTYDRCVSDFYTSEDMGLTLKHLEGAFYMLFALQALSIFIFFCEMYKGSNCCKPRDKKTDIAVEGDVP